MWRFLIRRLLGMIPILLGVTIISFLIISLTPGDFLTAMSLDPEISAERIEKLRKDFGLDRPWYVQYGLWLYRLSPFDLTHGFKWPDPGYSFAGKTPVAVLVGDRLWNTLILTLSAQAFIWLLAVPLGMFAAMKKNTWPDRALSFAAYFGLSMPEIVLALLALLFAARTHWFPVGGMHSFGYENMPVAHQLLDLLHHLVLPTFVLGIAGAAGIMRYMRGSLLETLTAGYIRTAFAKGLTSGQVVRRHAFRNSLNPIISLFGLSFASLISSSVLVEIIMGWPGIGRLTYEAVLTKDLYVLMATLMLATVFLIAGNLVADLLLAANDPRIREIGR